MTMNNVGIPVSSIVSSATAPSDGPVSSPVQSSGVFFRSLASAPSSPENNASQPKPQTQSPAPASNGTSSKGADNFYDIAGEDVRFRQSQESQQRPDNGRHQRHERTVNRQGRVRSRAPASVKSSSTAQTGAAMPTPVTGSSQATDATPNASAPPAGVVELLANTANSTKKSPAQAAQSSGRTLSNDSETTAPASLAGVLSQAVTTSATKSQTNAPQDASTGSSSSTGSTADAGATKATDALNLAAASAAPTSPSAGAIIAESRGRPKRQCRRPIDGWSGGLRQCRSGPSGERSRSIGRLKRTMRPWPPKSRLPRRATAPSTNMTGQPATPTVPTKEPPRAIKARRQKHRRRLTKRRLASRRASNRIRQPIQRRTRAMATGNSVSDSLQRTQELIDRVTNSLRPASTMAANCGCGSNPRRSAKCRSKSPPEIAA